MVLVDRVSSSANSLTLTPSTSSWSVYSVAVSQADLSQSLSVLGFHSHSQDTEGGARDGSELRRRLGDGQGQEIRCGIIFTRDRRMGRCSSNILISIIFSLSFDDLLRHSYLPLFVKEAVYKI